MMEKVMTSVLRKMMNEHMQFKPSDKPMVIPRYDGKSKLLLYVHIPFCQVLCTYCSFNRYKFESNTYDRYFNSVKKELAMYRDLGYKFEAMYIGGGTPTINMDGLEEIIGLVGDYYPVREISIETNPNHITNEYIERLQKMKVNRLSVGVETFDNDILKQMGRYEKYGSGEHIKDLLKNAIGKFDTLNLDIIFNMPSQTMASLQHDLDIIEELLPEQVTFYPLMVSNNTTALIEQNIGKVDYKKEKDFFYTILERMSKDYTGSTAWCFSRQQSMVDEYIIEYDDYVGVGSGSFGYLDGLNYANAFGLDDYSAAIDKGELPVFTAKRLTEDEQYKYYLMMHLFGLEIDPEHFKQKFGKDFYQTLGTEVNFLKLMGYITVDNGKIHPTRRGKHFMIMVMREFFIGVNNLRDFCRADFV